MGFSLYSPPTIDGVSSDSELAKYKHLTFKKFTYSYYDSASDAMGGPAPNFLYASQTTEM